MNQSTCRGLHHVALNVTDLEACLAFYTAMGLTPLRRWGEGAKAGAMLDAGNGCILEVFADGDGAAPKSAVIGHFALDVADTDAAFAAALATGARPDMEPKDIVIPSQPSYPARIAFVVAPTGERVELFQVK